MLSIRFWITTCAGIAAVAAAGSACAQTAAGVRDAKPNKSAASAAGGFVTARTKKAGAGVIVDYRVDYRVDSAPAAASGSAAPAPATITLRFSGVSAPDGATAEFQATGGARVDITGPLALAAGSTREVTLQLVPPADGYYTLIVRTHQAGRSSVIGVPVAVGGADQAQPKLARHGSVQKAADGEAVVSLPAK